MLRKLSLLVLSFTLVACGNDKDDYDPANDYFSYANTDEFLTLHLALDLDVDFDAHTLHGSVVLHMNVLDASAAEIVLDTRDIAIESVVFLRTNGTTEKAAFVMGATDSIKGTPLLITVPANILGATEVEIRIDYETSPQASALQWLPPELTAGGKHPMMFSQSQSIHARSWVPLQDTPAVRVTYTAVIHTPAELLAVMSANNDPLTPRTGEYQFDMPQPIPSYLLAIAVGNLYFAPLGDDTGVYTEPELLDASVYEFANTQDMLEVAEDQFGPYQWGRYDLLVLPPSFPFGGMENPRLSFLTPSLLAGDRSLVSVVAHELAHSWSGNLVTNATWRDGWLNEGMTSYLESRLMEIIYDKDRVDEERVLNYQELLGDFETVPLERQGLAPRFDSGNADDVQGTIHYHKGQLFLQHLENGFGRERFDEFLLGYFDHFAFKAITTEVFVDYLEEHLLNPNSDIISRQQVEVWMYQPGLPEDAPVPVSTTLDGAAELAAAWAIGEVSLDEVPVDKWSPQALIHFINSLPADLAEERLAALDAGLGLSETKNAEIARSWFIQVAKRRYTPAYAKLEEHLNRYGRARLVAPVFGSLVANGEDAELARSMFAKAESAYHPITKGYIERTLRSADAAVESTDSESDSESASSDAANFGHVDDQLFWSYEQKVAGFRNMEKIGPTRLVTAGEKPYPLRRNESDLGPVEFTFNDAVVTINEYVESQKVAGLIVVKDDVIIYERYELGNTEESRWVSYSVTKSVTSMLVGAAVNDGYIESVDEMITDYIPRLKNSSYDQSNIRNVLQMSSGVEWGEDYADPESDINVTPWATLEVYEYLRKKPREFEPGEVFNYNTAETNLVGDVVRAAIGNNLSTYLSEKIWKPFGMEHDAYWALTDVGGGEFGGCCLNATLRDYARIGLFAMKGGVLANGHKVLPDDWMADSISPSSGHEGYGYLWWLRGAGSFAASGIFGQRIHIDPANNIVIALHSARDDASNPEDWRMLTAAFTALVDAAKNLETDHE